MREKRGSNKRINNIKDMVNRVLELTRLGIKNDSNNYYYQVPMLLGGAVGAVFGASTVGGVLAIAKGLAIGALAPAVLLTSATGVISIFEATKEAVIENWQKPANKLKAILAGVLLAAPIITANVGVAKFAHSKFHEFADKKALIEEANTIRFNDELEVSGKFNKVTNTLTIESFEGKNIPKDAKFKVELK